MQGGKLSISLLRMTAEDTQVNTSEDGFYSTLKTTLNNIQSAMEKSGHWIWLKRNDKIQKNDH